MQHILEVAGIPTAESYSQVVCSAACVGNLSSHFPFLESLPSLERFHGQSLSLFLVVDCCRLLHPLQLISLVVEAEDHKSSSAMSFLRLRPRSHDLLGAKFKLPKEIISTRVNSVSKPPHIFKLVCRSRTDLRVCHDVTRD